MSESSSSQSRVRKIITTACNPCRKRKSRCDGDEPVCKMCIVYRSAESCSYDRQSDKRRLRTRQRAEDLTHRLYQLEGVFAKLRTCREEELPRLLSKIRSGESECAPVVIQRNSDRVKIEEGDELSQLVDGLQVDEEGEVHCYGESGKHIQVESIANKGTYKTRLSTNLRPCVDKHEFFAPDLVDELLNLYWKNQGQIPILDKRLFMRDRAESLNLGEPRKFYSEFLLCSILAYASHLHPSAFLCSRSNDVTSAGDVYYARCRDLIDYETLRPNVTTVQALLVLSCRDDGSNRQSRGWLYVGMAARVAKDLGIHLDCRDMVRNLKISVEENYVRSVTWWAVLFLDIGWGIYLGRPSSLLSESHTCPRPFTIGWPYSPSAMDIQISTCSDQLIDLLLLMQRVSVIQPTAKEQSRKYFWGKMQDWKLFNDDRILAYFEACPDRRSDLLLSFMLCRCTTILLFRPIITGDAPPISFVDAKGESLRAADEAVAFLERFHATSSFRRVSNNFSALVFILATTYLFLILEEEQACEEYHASIAKTLQYLQEMETTWHVAYTSRQEILLKLGKSNKAVLPEIEMMNSWPEPVVARQTQSNTPQAEFWPAYTTHSNLASEPHFTHYMPTFGQYNEEFALDPDSIVDGADGRYRANP